MRDCIRNPVSLNPLSAFSSEYCSGDDFVRYEVVSRQHKSYWLYRYGRKKCNVSGNSCCNEKKKKKKSEHNVPIHKQMKEWHKVLNQTSVNVVKKPTSFESNVNNFPHSSLTYQLPLFPHFTLSPDKTIMKEGVYDANKLPRITDTHKQSTSFQISPLI